MPAAGAYIETSRRSSCQLAPQAAAARCWTFGLFRRTHLPTPCRCQGCYLFAARKKQDHSHQLGRFSTRPRAAWRGRFHMGGEDEARAGRESSNWRHEDANRSGRGTLVVFSVSAQWAMLHEASLRPADGRRMTTRRSRRSPGPIRHSNGDVEVREAVIQQQDGQVCVSLTASGQTGARIEPSWAKRPSDSLQETWDRPAALHLSKLE
jgi:hypothetical protein